MNSILKWYHKLKTVYLLNKNKGHEAVDVTDPRDYLAGFPRGDLLPEKVDLLAKALDGGVKIIPQTKNACTSYARGNASMIANTINNNSVAVYDSERLWDLQVISGDADRSYGATLQSALREYHENPQGYPDAQYSRVKPSRDDIDTQIMMAKAWLARGRVLYSGLYWVGNNWNELKETGIYRNKKGRATGAHAIIFVGYDDEKQAFKLLEPLLYTFGDNEKGVVWLPYDEFFGTMSVTVLNDLDDKEFIK